MSYLTQTLCLTICLSCLNCRNSQDTTNLNASVPARFMIGPPQEPRLEANLVPSKESLQDSLTLRRNIAWHLAASVLDQVSKDKDSTYIAPRWMSFYDRQDLTQIIPAFGKHLKNGNMETKDAADKTFAEHHLLLTRIPIWTPERLKLWLSDLTTPQAMAGSFGLMRALYSPSVLSHLLIEHQSLNSLISLKDFPNEAITIKAAWHRSDQYKVPFYKTDADALKKRFEIDDWNNADAEHIVDPKKIFSLQLRDGSLFHLTGLHMGFKLLKEWYWITLWWSPDPNEDFGSDRPNTPTLSDSIWKNYKMCTVVDYKEHDHANDISSSSLAAAYREVNDAMKQSSWCSNPYLEKGHHNVKTNCIACHQHAGTHLTQEAILAPNAQSLRQDRTRADFPADYVYGVTSEPDNISARLTNQLGQ